MEVLQAPPSALGGTVVPGLYFVTKVNVYRMASGAALPTLQEAMNLGSNTYALNSYIDGQQGSPESGTYSTSGTMFTRTSSCPGAGGGPYSHPYTATSTTLTLYEGGGTTDTYEIVFTKQ
jgi:hypothetical protein